MKKICLSLLACLVLSSCANGPVEKKEKRLDRMEDCECHESCGCRSGK